MIIFEVFRAGGERQALNYMVCCRICAVDTLLTKMATSSDASFSISSNLLSGWKSLALDMIFRQAWLSLSSFNTTFIL